MTHTRSAHTNSAFLGEKVNLQWRGFSLALFASERMAVVLVHRQLKHTPSFILVLVAKEYKLN